MTPVGLECPDFFLPAIEPLEVCLVPGEGERRGKKRKRGGGKGRTEGSSEYTLVAGGGGGGETGRAGKGSRGRRSQGRKRRRGKRKKKGEKEEKEEEKGLKDEGKDKVAAAAGEEGRAAGNKGARKASKPEATPSLFTKEGLEAARYLGACMSVMEMLYGPDMGFGRASPSASVRSDGREAGAGVTLAPVLSSSLLWPSPGVEELESPDQEASEVLFVSDSAPASPRRA